VTDEQKLLAAYERGLEAGRREAADAVTRIAQAHRRRNTSHGDCKAAAAEECLEAIRELSTAQQGEG